MTVDHRILNLIIDLMVFNETNSQAILDRLNESDLQDIRATLGGTKLRVERELMNRG
jgi:hypothetical protein